MERRSHGPNATSPLSSPRSSTSSDRQTIIVETLDDSRSPSTPSKIYFSRTKETVSRGKDSVTDTDSISRDKKSFRLRSRADSIREDEYDISINRNPTKTTNIKQGIAALVKGCLGGGMVCVHEGYMECGLWTAVAINFFLGIIISYCMYMLTQSVQRMYSRIQVSTMSYPDLAEAAVEIGPFERLQRHSRCVRHLVETFVCIGDFGSCCAYQIMIAHSIQELLHPADINYVSAATLQSMRIYIACLVIPCALFIIFTTEKDLAPFSVVANFYVVLIAISTIYFGADAAKGSPLDMPAYRSTADLFEFTGVLLFSLDGVGAVLAVENGIRNPKHVPYVMAGGMTIVVVIIFIIGFFGYWGFGDNCLSPVTLNFPWYIYPITLKTFLAMMIFVTFGLHFCNPFNIVWYYISFHHDPEKHWIWEKVYRGAAVIVITLIAITFPNINHIIGLLGSFCVSQTACVFPALISLVVEWERPGLGKFYWRLWRTAFLLILGSALFITGTVANSYRLIAEPYFPNSSNNVWL